MADLLHHPKANRAPYERQSYRPSPNVTPMYRRGGTRVREGDVREIQDNLAAFVRRTR